MAKSICFIGGGLAGGGQERALTNLANAFAEKGHQITIICLFKTEIFFEIHPSITIIWPDVDRKTTHKFVYALQLIPYIRKNIIRSSPDSVVAFGDWFNAYVLLSTRLLNKPVYITNRMGPNLYLGKFMEFFNRLTYKKATAMIVQTNRAEQIMQNKYGVKDVRIVANAVKPVDVTNRTPEKSIITVGRLSKEKGHIVLIKAFAQLDNSEWRLDIVGDGPEMETLKKLVSDLQLNHSVNFHGHKKDFKDLLAKASLFVLPSFYEGFPNALIEAMSVPIACISSDCTAGPAEIIQHGENGFLFETGNADALFLILKDLTSDPAKIAAIEEKALEVRNRYNFNTISNQFLTEILR